MFIHLSHEKSVICFPKIVKSILPPPKQGLLSMCPSKTRIMGVYVCVYSIVRASFTLEADISLVSIGLEPSTSAEELLAMSRGTIQTLHINITQTTAPQCNGLYEQSQGCSSLPPPPPPPPVVSACSRSCQHISL